MKLGTLVAGGGLVVLALIGAACSSSDSGGDASAGPATEADFQAQIASERCSRVALCCTAAKQTFDQAKCEQQVRAGFPSATADGGASALAYDAAKAAACLAEVKAKPATCASLFETEPTPSGGSGGPTRVTGACSLVYHGTKQVGEACASTAECAPDAKGFAYCNPSLQPADAGAGGLGTCQKVEIVGGECGDKSQAGMPGSFYVCEDGTCDGFCEAISGPGGLCKQFTSTKCDVGLTCVNDACVAPPGAGQPCPNGQCADGAYCDMGTCAAQKDEGAACTGNDCKAPLQCQGGTCTLPAAEQCTLGR